MKLPLLARVVLTAIAAFLVVDLGLPLVAMWVAGAPSLVLLPGFARGLYFLLVVSGALVYVSASEQTLAETRRAITSFFAPGPRRRGPALVRRGVLIAVPLAAGALVWLALAPREATPPTLRTQHPTLPQAWETLKNPVRELPDAARGAALAEGRDLFQIACRPCHGAAGDGKGPMARGLRLKPADFTDTGTIATVVEPYAFWRVSEGGPGLPAEATPWDSAMPVWKHDLGERERWQAVVAAYDVAGVEPRKPEGSTAAATTALASTPREAGDGERIYLARCAACHGEKGDGKGPVAAYLDPDPRDFTSGVFKLRTTEAGQPPTDDDLFRVVTNGIPGTAMPAWNHLPERERRLVIDYLKRFSETFKEKGTILKPSKSVATSASVVARGREVYRAAKCWECHGETGRADGPSAPTLKDEDGHPISPADLTKGWRLKGGRDAADIFMRLSTGMDGTPMPSYADTLPEEDRWALAHYVRALQDDVPTGVVLRARVITGDVPRAADDARWQNAPRLSIPLAGQVVVRPRWQNHGIDEVVARAVFNDRELALLLEWDDGSRDTTHREPGAPKAGRAGYVIAEERAGDFSLRDALRVQLARPGLDRPHFLLGQRGRSVTLWHWRADTNAVTVERAEGPETPPTAQPNATQVESRAAWKDGRWSLVLVRRLAPGDRQDVAFERGTLVPFAIHAWDGSRGERDLIMAVSSWTFLMLEPAASAVPPLVGAVAALLVAAGEWGLVRRARNPR